MNMPENERRRTLTRLVEQHQGALLRVCYVILRDRELARDAVQETFLKAYESLGGFRGDCAERTWLMRIAMNTCRDMLRSGWLRHNDRRVTPEDLPLATNAPCDPDALGLMCEVMALPRKLREAVVLYYWQDMTVGEVARALGITHSSASFRLARARGKLRVMLEGRFDRGRSDDEAGRPSGV